MNKNDLLKLIDMEKYNEDCETAMKTAEYCGKKDNPYSGVHFDTAHDLSWILWDLEIKESEKLDMLFELYTEMPCYAYLMYLSHEYKRCFSKHMRRKVLRWFNNIILSDNKVLKNPILYSLWCNYLDDSEFSNSVWSKLLTLGNGKKNSIQALLSVSGPVDWDLKHKLIRELITDKKWHLMIYDSLLFSMYDTDGQINKLDAKSILSKLVIDINQDDLEKFYFDLDN